MIIKLLDVNDETPIFEKSYYEFILTPDFRNFTIPAIIHAIDNDAEPPNNEVRYELIYGNYENKFFLHPISGQLTLNEPLIKLNSKSVREKRQPSQQQDDGMYLLTARAYDLGVPVRWSSTTIRIYPPESRTRTVSFLVPGKDPDRQRVHDTLAEITGGKVIIQDIRPYNGKPSQTILPQDKDRSLVLATILYDGNSVVDLAKVQERLSINGTLISLIAEEERTAVRLKL